jgi:hypothetical protein
VKSSGCGAMMSRPPSPSEVRLANQYDVQQRGSLTGMSLAIVAQPDRFRFSDHMTGSDRIASITGRAVGEGL